MWKDGGLIDRLTTFTLWVSGITSRATEFYFTDFLSVAVHFNIQNIIYSDLPMCNKYREVRDFSREVIPLTHSVMILNRTAQVMRWYTT